MTDIKDVLLADQQKGQADNTAARQVLKEQLGKSPVVHAAISVALLIIIFYLAVAGSWNFFWLIAVGAGLIYAGRKLVGVKDKIPFLGYWPIVLQAIGAAIILVTAGSSGFTKGAAVLINNTETAADCYADPNQTICQQAETEDRAPTQYQGGPTSSNPGSFQVRIPPGGQSEKVTHFENTCLKLDWVDGNDAIEIYSQDRNGVTYEYLVERAYKVWLVLPESDRQGATFLFTRRNC